MFSTGFADLMGYHGRQARFTIERDDGGTHRPLTAATCFNTLNLPPYESAQTLAARSSVVVFSFLSKKEKQGVVHFGSATFSLLELFILAAQLLQELEQRTLQ